MAHFEYITMVVSFVLAFAVSHTLSGWARQWTWRRERPPYPLHTVASALFLVTVVQSIWGSWIYREVPWTFGAFSLYFASTLPLAGAAVLIHPPPKADTPPDWRAHYFDNGTAAYALIAGWVVLNGVLEWLMRAHVPQFRSDQAFMLVVRTVSVALMLFLARSKSPRHHWAGLAALTFTLAAFVLRDALGRPPS